MSSFYDWDVCRDVFQEQIKVWRASVLYAIIAKPCGESNNIYVLVDFSAPSRVIVIF